MPKFRALAERDRQQAGVFLAASTEARAESRPATAPGRVCVPAAGELRGIPAIGRGVSGASPGTRPDVDGVNRADRSVAMVAFL